MSSSPDLRNKHNQRGMVHRRFRQAQSLNERSAFIPHDTHILFIYFFIVLPDIGSMTKKTFAYFLALVTEDWGTVEESSLVFLGRMWLYRAFYHPKWTTA